LKHHGPTEHEIQSAIIAWLEIKHYCFWRNNSGTATFGKRRVKFGKKGSPDIFVVIAGRIIGIEVKAEKGYQSREQHQFEVEFVKAGGKYLLCFSLEDAISGIAAQQQRIDAVKALPDKWHQTIFDERTMFRQGQELGFEKCADELRTALGEE
jgi:hypothetical protein